MMPIALILAVAYLVLEPPSADLAAQAFRSELFDRHGFLVWSNAWYSGHHVAGYSLLFPPLGALLGPRLAGALAAVAAAGLFAALARNRYGDRAALASAWFGLGAATTLYTGRLTFALGLAVGLAALVALDRGRRLPAAALALLTPAASPLAGMFLALAGAAAFLGARVPGSAALAASGGAATLAIGLAFPTGGQEPFVLSALLPVALLAPVALGLVLPRSERVLRAGVVLYALLALALFVFHTPVGGNVTRLGAIAAGPVAALVLAGRRPALLALLAVPLLYWQLVAPVRDLDAALGDPSTELAYHRPLLDELERRGASELGEPLAGEGHRVHVLPTRNRWEAAYVGERHPLARGWLRQAESDDFALFGAEDGEGGGEELDADSYREWLDERAVRFVAVPDAELDYLAEREAELIASGLVYLREAWAGEHWRLYELADPAPLARGAEVTALGVDWVELSFAAAADGDRPGAARRSRPDAAGADPTGGGEALVRVHHTPYWGVEEGRACLAQAGRWLRVSSSEAGTVRIAARLGSGRLAILPGAGGRRCSG